MPLTVLPPEWTRKINTDEFIDRLHDKITFEIRSRKGEISRALGGNFTVTVRQDNGLQVKIKPRKKGKFKKSHGGDLERLDKEAQAVVDKVVQESIDKAFEDLIGEMASGI